MRTSRLPLPARSEHRPIPLADRSAACRFALEHGHRSPGWGVRPLLLARLLCMTGDVMYRNAATYGLRNYVDSRCRTLLTSREHEGIGQQVHDVIGRNYARLCRHGHDVCMQQRFAPARVRAGSPQLLEMAGLLEVPVEATRQCTLEVVWRRYLARMADEMLAACKHGGVQGHAPSVVERWLDEAVFPRVTQLRNYKATPMQRPLRCTPEPLGSRARKTAPPCYEEADSDLLSTDPVFSEEDAAWLLERQMQF